MRATQILKLLLLTGLLSGCWFVHIKGEAPGSLGNIDLLQSFIGQESESVIRELGLPREVLSDGEKQFMLYSATSDETSILMVTWAPVWAFDDIENTAHCLRFELDSDNVVKDYRLESRVIGTYALTLEFNLTSNCREVFWNEKELTKLKKTTDFPSTWIESEKKWEERRKQATNERLELQRKQLELKAEQGDADSQYKMFENLSVRKPQEALAWLCRSADSGNQSARVTLAGLYEGESDYDTLIGKGYKWLKQGFVESNYKLSYVWRVLSGRFDQAHLEYFADRFLTTEEQLEAEKMLKEWQPGNCERELGLDRDELSNIN